MPNGDGCEYGHLNRLKIDNLEECYKSLLNKIDKRDESVEKKLTAGIIIGVIISVLAGMNTWNELVKLIVMAMK